MVRREIHIIFFGSMHMSLIHLLIRTSVCVCEEQKVLIKKGDIIYGKRAKEC